MPPGETPIETVLYKLEDIEKRRAEDRRHFDAAVSELKADMRSSIASIAYVSKEQFTDFKAAVTKEADETRSIATDARKLSLAVLWVLIVGFSGALIAVLVRLAIA